LGTLLGPNLAEHRPTPENNLQKIQKPNIYIYIYIYVVFGLFPVLSPSKDMGGLSGP
jgi:hypothetical protein